MPEPSGAPRKSFPPAMLAMNSLGDAYKDNLKKQGKTLLGFEGAYAAWSDFRDWLQTDIKTRSPNNDVHLVYARTLPKYERFQSWFHWQRNKEKDARLAEGDAIFNKAYEVSESTKRPLGEVLREMRK